LHYSPVSQGRFLTSFAALVEDSLNSGDIQIQVVEGRLLDGDIEIEIQGSGDNRERLSRNYILSRIRRGVTTPLSINKLEEHLRLLRADPLIENVEPTLSATERGEIGRSQLKLKVTEARAIGVEAYTDNYSPPSVGGERFGFEIFHRNLSGLGDTLAASYDRSVPGSSETVEARYRVPINGLNGTIELRANFHDNEIIQEPFDELELRGDSERYQISYRQPLIRNLRKELALSFGFTWREGQTFALSNGTPFSIGPDDDGISRTSVFKFGQDFVRRDPNGVWALQSQLNIGTGILDATTNLDSSPDGEFMSWLLQGQRIQRLGERQFLIISADLQLTPNSLLPSEQFVVGGGQSIRGYRQNSHAGDSGFRVSIEDQIIVKRNNRDNPLLVVAPFVDMGSVWNSGDNPNPQVDEPFILGVGAGIELRPIPGLSFRVDYGLPVINTDEGENIQDSALYFKARYGFPR
jgi:hemolysin activation/secretion protein